MLDTLLEQPLANTLEPLLEDPLEDLLDFAPRPLRAPLELRSPVRFAHCCQKRGFIAARFNRPSGISAVGYQLIPQEHRHRAALADAALKALYEIGSPLVGRLVLSIAADGPDNIKAIAQRIGVPTTSAWAAVRSVSLGRIRIGKVVPPKAKLLCVTRSGDGNGRLIYLTPQGDDLARALIGL